MADDDLVDIGLCELLGLYLVLLRGAEQVVEKRHVELEDLDELEDTPVGDVEFAVEVERSRVGVGPVLGDLAVVDVACELRRVLVFLVFGLKRSDANAILLAEHESPHAHMVVNHLCPVAVVLLHQVLEDEPARGVQVAVDSDLELLV